MNTIKLKLNLKTPLWTGDIDSKSDLVQTTGIIGSLRWWLEAILRGSGKFICDPTSDNRCPTSKKEYCIACFLFGSTGIRRPFSINITGGRPLFRGPPINIKPKNRNRGWYLGSGIVGELEIQVNSLDKDFEKEVFLVPLIIASKWGGIGAKTQIGYGVVEISNSEGFGADFNGFETPIENKKDKLRVEVGNDNNTTSLVNISEMFFAKVQFKSDGNDWWKSVNGIKAIINNPKMMNQLNNWIKSGSVPIAPAIKNWIRYEDGKSLWNPHNNVNQTLENWLFGTIQQEKRASKINISSAYRIDKNIWEFRIWGWIPTVGCPDGFSRDVFLKNLKQSLNGSGSTKLPWVDLSGNNTTNHRLTVWREFNSNRDTVKQNESDINNFIQSLLNNEGGI